MLQIGGGTEISEIYDNLIFMMPPITFGIFWHFIQKRLSKKIGGRKQRK